MHQRSHPVTQTHCPLKIRRGALDSLPTYPTEVTKPEGALLFPDGLLQESQV